MVSPWCTKCLLDDCIIVFHSYVWYIRRAWRTIPATTEVYKHCKHPAKAIWSNFKLQIQCLVQGFTRASRSSVRQRVGGTTSILSIILLFDVARKKKQILYLVFIDYMKAYDKVIGGTLLQMLSAKLRVWQQLHQSNWKLFRQKFKPNRRRDFHFYDWC